MDKINTFENLGFKHLEMLKPVCIDLGVELKNVQPYHWQLHKLGCPSMTIMTINLTTCINGKWKMGNSIEQVYNQILYNFKSIKI